MEYLFTDCDNLPIAFKISLHELKEFNKFLATTKIEQDLGYSKYVVDGIVRKFDATLKEDVSNQINCLSESLKIKENDNA